MSTSAITNSTTTNSAVATNPKSVLGKDDFMKLLLTELQYQDPTDPMDSEKILTQTSQLATLESADNTNKTMEKLVNQLNSSSDLNAVSAIGKTGSLGTDSITLGKNDNPTFDMYFKHNIASGTIHITDAKGNIVKTFDLKTHDAGVQSFQWDGKDNSGNRLPEGKYSITSDYSDGSTGSYKSVYGIFPIESVRFDSGKALLKLGSKYYPLSDIKEIYQ